MELVPIGHNHNLSHSNSISVLISKPYTHLYLHLRYFPLIKFSPSGSIIASYSLFGVFFYYFLIFDRMVSQSTQFYHSRLVNISMAKLIPLVNHDFLENPTELGMSLKEEDLFPLRLS